ncbi:hypothetical protein OJF2_41670 [Aquisphaera giovannonii]|uniref:Uncharacterized protein n=1 Tax=Aquisphaera giovannonii TaxID=406548 RepID=A0A5B9W5X8_9BACT|nr:hypothetical protein [Aquisphaera giovannonii]QEH35614.1 hypothetical protein OJF2_41670 [Aquisphaera giovannonii]
MSTAGKVLIVLIVLGIIGWALLAAGVDELNRNNNNALVELEKKVEQLQKDVKDAQVRISRVKDATTVMQEKIDRDVATLHARYTDVQRASSKIRDELARVQYERSVVQEHVEGAEKSRTERTSEVAAETKNLADKRAEVEGLKAKDAELVKQLEDLREQFKKTLAANAQALTRR